MAAFWFAESERTLVVLRVMLVGFFTRVPGFSLLVGALFGLPNDYVLRVTSSLMLTPCPYFPHANLPRF